MHLRCLCMTCQQKHKTLKNTETKDPKVYITLLCAPWAMPSATAPGPVKLSSQIYMILNTQDKPSTDSVDTPTHTQKLIRTNVCILLLRVMVHSLNIGDLSLHSGTFHESLGSTLCSSIKHFKQSATSRSIPPLPQPFYTWTPAPGNMC